MHIMSVSFSRYIFLLHNKKYQQTVQVIKFHQKCFLPRSCAYNVYFWTFFKLELLLVL